MSHCPRYESHLPMVLQSLDLPKSLNLVRVNGYLVLADTDPKHNTPLRPTDFLELDMTCWGHL